MANKRYPSEELAGRLTDDARRALPVATFNGYGLALEAPASEVLELLVSLNLVRLIKGQLVTTSTGFGVRAVIPLGGPPAPD